MTTACSSGTGLDVPVKGLLGPTADAFTCTRNIWVKFGFLRTGEERSWAYDVLKAVSQSSDQVTGFLWVLLVSAVSGAAMVADWGTNRRYQPAKPKKDSTSFLVRGRGQFRITNSFGRTSPHLSWYPNYRVSCHARSHLVGLPCPASWILHKTSDRYRTCSSQVLLKITTSSI